MDVQVFLNISSLVFHISIKFNPTCRFLLLLLSVGSLPKLLLILLLIYAYINLRIDSMHSYPAVNIFISYSGSVCGFPGFPRSVTTPSASSTLPYLGPWDLPCLVPVVLDSGRNVSSASSLSIVALEVDSHLHGGPGWCLFIPLQKFYY